MTVIARAALLLSALAGCAVVSVRYTLAPLRPRPGCLLGWRNAWWKEFSPRNRNWSILVRSLMRSWHLPHPTIANVRTSNAGLRNPRLCEPAPKGSRRQSPTDRRPKGGRLRKARRSQRGSGLAPNSRRAQGDARTARELILARLRCT